MYFLTTADIVSPETLQTIVRRMTVLSPENLRTLDAQYGIDNVPCVWCKDMGAVESVTRDMMDGKI